MAAAPGFVYFLILDDLNRVDLLELIWIGVGCDHPIVQRCFPPYVEPAEANQRRSTVYEMPDSELVVLVVAVGTAATATDGERPDRLDCSAGGAWPARPGQVS
ncbi:MAG: hypothetical protein L0H64_09945 [Pseudonocardia sp.]|nr:hypothetical protein [Pseudonocardia sp.]